MGQNEWIAEAKKKFRLGDVFCPPKGCWNSYPEGNYILKSTEYKSDGRGVYAMSDRGDVWLYFSGEWAELRICDEKRIKRMESLEIRGKYRERLRELADENTQLRHENQQLKQLLAKSS